MIPFVLPLRYLLAMVFLTFSLGVSGDSSPSSPSLAALLHQRLSLMDEVAAHKWRHKQPVEDLVREKVVIEQATEDALAHGLVPASSRRLFIAQMEASKEIQRYWFARWQEGAVLPETVPDLDRDIRPELLRLGSAIVAAAAVRRPGDRAVLEQAFVVEGLSVAGQNRLMSAIDQLELYPSRLEQILDTGQLRVGTTGDYEPFSWRDEGGGFRGIDIDLARDLAAALGVKAVFVATSWPALMADLQAGRFDIAMGGVSRTLERQRRGFFSIPYHVGGKTAIARCSDREKFTSLETIDQPGVRVIVNPGGTNEQFVDAHIKRARKVLYPDNRTIFQQLVTGHGDVMITDRIEAEWQAARMPELCLPLVGTLTYQEKAYLMPRDFALKEFVDTWLSLRLAEGLIAGVLRPPKPEHPR